MEVRALGQLLLRKLKLKAARADVAPQEQKSFVYKSFVNVHALNVTS